MTEEVKVTRVKSEDKIKKYPEYEWGKETANVFQWLQQAAAQIRAAHQLERINRRPPKVVMPEHDPRSK